MIFIGDQLVVSNPGTVVDTPTTPTPEPKPETKSTPETTTPAPTTGKTYTVRPGDYLYKIATDNNITVEQLKSWNNLTSNYIYSGDKLTVTNPATVTPKPENPKPETPKPEPTPDPVTPPVTETPKAKTYTVRPGDYLYKIATQNNVSIEQLKAWNNLTSNYIYSGDVFYVTDPSKAPVKLTPTPDPKPEIPKPETPTPNPTPTTPTKTYTVRPGDSLWLIANNNGITIDQLKAWNKLTSNYIYSGDVFVVTDPSQVPAPKPEPKPEIPTTPPVVDEGDTTETTFDVKINKPDLAFYVG